MLAVLPSTTTLTSAIYGPTSLKISCGGFLSLKDIFIHITALKDMPRRPIVGDIIYFQIEHGEDGKARATSARIEGLAKTPRKTRTKKDRNGYLFVFGFCVVVLVVILISFLVYYKSVEEEDFTGYKCEGKRYCSEMTCKEARFYIKNCPNVEIDGDLDGIPCERQCR